MPGPVQVSFDFVSPTELAWADLPPWDFAVNPARPIDEVAWRNLHPLTAFRRQTSTVDTPSGTCPASVMGSV